MPYIDAHDLLANIVKWEIDSVTPEPEDDIDYIEPTHYMCPVCGRAFQPKNQSTTCGETNCTKYKNYKYQDNYQLSRQRSKKMAELHESGKTLQEIHDLGYGSSAGNVKTCIRKYHETQVKRNNVYTHIDNIRKRNGLTEEFDVTQYKKQSTALPPV